MIEDTIIENAVRKSLESFGEFIEATIDGIQMSVPIDPANRHYAEIMRQVEAGTLTISEAVNG